MRRLTVMLALGVASVTLLGCSEDGPSANLRPGSTDSPSASEAPSAPLETAPPDAAPPTEAPLEVAPPDAAPPTAPPLEVAPPTEVPPVTEAPLAPAPPPPAPPPPVPTAPDDPAFTTIPESDPLVPADDDSILPTLLGIVLLLAAGVAVVALLRRRKSGATDEASSPQPPDQATLLSTGRWIHDRLTLELMAATPADAWSRWITERSRLDNVAIGALAQFDADKGASWQAFAEAVSALSSALDTNLRLRIQVPQDLRSIAESNEVVHRTRGVLRAWIAALEPTIR